MACEQWEPGAPVPQSALGGTVSWLIDNCSITECLTCLVSAFMGSTLASKPGGTVPATCAGQANKPTMNTSILALCRPTVDLFNVQYPTMSFLSLIKKGGLKYSDLQVGGKGDWRRGAGPLDSAPQSCDQAAKVRHFCINLHCPRAHGRTSLA
jgi:hypothetical protein